MPVWMQAGFWGLVAGSALLVGAAIAYFAHVPRRWIAAVMAFGGGVLISALSFDLMDEALPAWRVRQPRPDSWVVPRSTRRSTGTSRTTGPGIASARARSSHRNSKKVAAAWL